MTRVVFMGVAGCGKSTVARHVADALQLPLVEGDDFHAEASRAKMRDGIALTDDDRWGWLAALGQQLQAHPGGVMLTCSALKRAYRERLRAAAPDVRFVFLDLSPEAAAQRVTSRSQHFFSPSLVASQFAALERPDGEAGVLRVDATRACEPLSSDIREWLRADAPSLRA